MRILLFIGFMLATSGAGAAQHQHTAPAQIRAAAAAFLEAFAAEQHQEGLRVTFELGGIDSRLRLAPCDAGPQVEFNGDPWRSTRPRLMVACDGERPWKLFLGTDLTIEGKALVAARPLNRGTRITSGMISSVDVVINSVRRGAVTEMKHLIGMEVRRPLNAGTVFTPDLVAAPDAVARGDHVIITARSGSFSVRSRGKALASGAVGDQVMIENLASSRKIRGLITGPGQIEIPM
ncbi:flagellar basal body P-ring formation chaperone FlgA [Marinobacter sp.]|uniref:flagellar basal body P-ring formation chaperone FlgA n=1 Tax=Marinobacter sp. TaxID=50741 RepID=UPI00384BCEE5